MSLLLLALWGGVAEAGPWTRGFGEHYVKLGSDTYLPFRFEDPVRGVVDDTYVGELISAYGEVGLTPGHPIQLTASVPLSIGVVNFEREQGGIDVTGTATVVRVGDIRLGLQTALLPPRIAPVAVGVEFKIPGYANDSVGQDEGTWQTVFPRPGDGQLDMTVWLLGGTSFLGGKGWVEAWLGYRWRSSIFMGWTVDEDFVDFADSIPFRLTVGGRVGPALLMGQVDGWVNAVREDLTREAISVGPAVLVDVYKTLAIEGRVGVEPWALKGAQGVSVGVGLSWRSN
ncbi:MAG: hypothetical protein ACON5B_03740 [Myxococcota bacterium]